MDTVELSIIAGSRPYPGECENGDAWSVSRFPGLYRVSLIDGLGHGACAARASLVARQTLEALGPEEPREVIRRCHLALSGTRGVVMAVANIDLAHGRLTYAGVGNTEARFHGTADNNSTRLVSDRGIVGLTLPTIHPMELALPEHWQFLLYTDGVRDRFDLQDELREAATSPNWPAEFLQRWGRTHDDATVVLISPR